MPNCVQSSQNAAIRSLAARRGLLLVDGERVIREAAPDGLPGFELFWDNSHPVFEGHFLIASELVRVLEERYETRRACTVYDPGALEVALGFGPEFEREVLIGRAQYNYGRSALTWNPARRLARARECLDRAAALGPEDAKLLASRAVLALLEGELDQSRDLWRDAYAADPALARERLQHGYLRKVLEQHGIEDPEAMFRP
jgi:tetratricopeptide (TPR) repeat protein